jgi:GDPmannose 4,6-dehydratase
VKDLVATAFACVDLNWEDYVEINPKFLRQDEHFQLVANPTKAKTKLGWNPQVSFEQLLEKMVQHDLELLKQGEIG